MTREEVEVIKYILSLEMPEGELAKIKEILKQYVCLRKSYDDKMYQRSDANETKEVIQNDTK